ncbi:Hypothetical protein FKW44_006964 [Caligus rogercresseyi]|uniref:Uncharacterized protein n=1 Tax=Caligus rogercresseyi TaxID=217165 RepID=A0A7T8KE75_CALRO|nr:Hypothetical protein FKW44_006964 [Caligus rogercresseyi]
MDLEVTTPSPRTSSAALWPLAVWRRWTPASRHCGLETEPGHPGSQDQALRQHDMDEMEASQEDASEKILNESQAWNRRPIKASMEVTRDIFPPEPQVGLDGAFHQVQHAAPQLCYSANLSGRAE